MYESFPRSRSRPARTISPWSKASGGRLVDGLPGGVLGQLGVDAGRDDAEERGRELAARGLRPGSLHEPSCSRCASSRTSTFAARWRRIDASSVSSGSSVPPGSAQAPASGSRARCQRSACRRAVAHLEHDREHDLRRGCERGCGRIGLRFAPHSLKPNRKALRMRRLDIPLALLLLAASSSPAAAAPMTRPARRRRRPRRGGREPITRRPDHRPGPARRQRLQRARVPRAHSGRRRSSAIKGRVVESASAADYIPNMSSLARDGYDLMIGVGFAQGDAIGKVAQKFPKTKFAIIDVDQAFVPGKPANVQGLLFREQEVGYLAGYLAGLEEKRRDGPGRRSAPSAACKEPPVDRFIAGYFAGAAKADAGDQDDARLLAGLGRPGEVQGAGAEPDRARLEGRLPGRRRLRSRRAERGRRARPLGHRRRRRPVVPRPAHPHERAEGRRRGGLPDDQGRSRTAPGRAAATRPSASRRTASGSAR